MNHEIPMRPIDVWKAILRELILAREPDATFTDEVTEPDVVVPDPRGPGYE